ncbi:MAG: hypothetical protein KC917_24020, partial [Candidatus Omnitrophica bacterium]|nr:hypothetical protein [Candidatus Omnitrophota bacterium]
MTRDPSPDCQERSETGLLATILRIHLFPYIGISILLLTFPSNVGGAMSEKNEMQPKYTNHLIDET